MLLVVELLPARARLVLAGDALRRHGQHGDQVPLERVIIQDAGQALHEPRSLDGVSPVDHIINNIQFES